LILDCWSDLLLFPGKMDNKLRQTSLLQYLSRPAKPPVYFIIDGDSEDRSSAADINICVDCAISLGMPRLLIFRPPDLDPGMLAQPHPDYVVSNDSYSAESSTCVSSTTNSSTCDSSTTNSSTTDSSGHDGDVCGSTASDEEDEDSDDNDFIVDDNETVSVHSSTTYVGGLLPHKKKKKYDDSTDSSDSSSTTS